MTRDRVTEALSIMVSLFVLVGLFAKGAPVKAQDPAPVGGHADGSCPPSGWLWTGVRWIDCSAPTPTAAPQPTPKPPLVLSEDCQLAIDVEALLAACKAQKR